MASKQPVVGIIMGSKSDWPTLKGGRGAVLEELGVAYETRVVSAHRTPDRLYDYATRRRGARPENRHRRRRRRGASARHDRRDDDTPVLGVPVEIEDAEGSDSLLSIVQMPAGIPVGDLRYRRGGRQKRRPVRGLDTGA